MDKAKLFEKYLHREIRKAIKEYTWKDVKFTDCTIGERDSGGFDVSCGGDKVGAFNTYKEALKAVNDWKNKKGFRPDTWLETKDGKVQLIGDDGKPLNKGIR